MHSFGGLLEKNTQGPSVMTNYIRSSHFFAFMMTFKVRFEVTEVLLCFHTGRLILLLEGDIYGELFNFMQFINYLQINLFFLAQLFLYFEGSSFSFTVIVIILYKLNMIDVLCQWQNVTSLNGLCLS